MEKSSQSPATTQETQAPAIPGLLDGVVIDSCVFTESVGKREPRPPLFCMLYGDGRLTGDVYLRLQDLGAWAFVHIADWASPIRGLGRSEYDRLYPLTRGAPRGPAYTGPITPAMWVWIRKYWNP